MSEPLGPGPADVAARWIGVRRHQAVLAVLGVVALGDGLLRTRSVLEVTLAVLLGAGALPLGAETLGGVVAAAIAFSLRRRWSRLTVARAGDRVVVESREVLGVNAFVLQHRGRLDLNGQDHLVAARLAASIDAAASADRHDRRIGVHVCRDGARASTVLVTPADGVAPAGWDRDDDALFTAASARRGTSWWLERWWYLRTSDHVTCVLRVGDLRGTSHDALLAGLQNLGERVTLSIQVTAIGGTERARRVAERAVHRQRSDRATTVAAGFRSTARTQLVEARAERRELDVASGRSLMRLRVYVTVRASSCSALRDAREAARRRALDAGVRLDRGGGRQWLWFIDQLTGSTPRAATHWITSADLDALRVPSHDAGSGLDGRALGTVAGGAPFALDPFDLYGAGLVANPNVVVAGAIGVGKSTVVKMMVDRALARGRRAVIVDPKGEYGDLARRYGCRSVALGRDGWCDPFLDATDASALARAMIASAQGQPLTDEQHFAFDEAWEALGRDRPTRVMRALFESTRPALDGQASPSRSLALTLRRFVDGDLAGLFDGPGEPVTLDGDLVVLDLSAQWSGDAMAVAALSAVAAAQRVAAAAGAGYVVLDEAWALLSDPNALAWLRGSWKLARSLGVSHVLVLHRWGDVAAVGDEGSAQRERARGLLRECETAWLFRQPPDEANDVATALALSTLERRTLSDLRRGEALVRYGAHRSVVRVTPDAADHQIIDTDAAMRV